MTSKYLGCEATWVRISLVTNQFGYKVSWFHSKKNLSKFPSFLKSGIMVYGETPACGKYNAVRRVFKLGPDRVNERSNYDLMGVTACLFENDMTGIEGRLAKARRALNAISGMGIRRNGLTVATCCLIFWVIVAPIALFGCEMLVLNDRSIRLIEEFQTYAGKRIHTETLQQNTKCVCVFRFRMDPSWTFHWSQEVTFCTFNYGSGWWWSFKDDLL